MLSHAILILTIINTDKITMDYELYNDVEYCQSVSEYINEYNKDSGLVKCTCVNLDDEMAKQ